VICVLAVAAAIAATGSIPVLSESIDLPKRVPSFNQNYTEGPGAWGNCILGTGGCPDLICTTGCLVTAFASVLGYYDVVLSIPASESCAGKAQRGMDPGILNDWLRANGGFGACPQDPMGSCCLAWNELPGNVQLKFYENRSVADLNPVAAVVIDHALRSGHPVVAGVHWGAVCRAGSSQSEDCHWVVLTGKIGNTYTIVDPINLDPSDPQGLRTTLDAGTRGAYIIDRYVVVEQVESTAGTPSTQDPTEGDTPARVETSSAAGTALALLALLAAVGLAVILLAKG